MVNTKKSLSVQNNNPGNIKYAEYLRIKYGAKPSHKATDGGVFAKFPDYETGRLAMRNLLTSDFYKGKDINSGLKIWSGNGYGADLVPEFKGRLLGDLTDSEMNILMDKMQVREGWHGAGSSSPKKPTYSKPQYENGLELLKKYQRPEHLIQMNDGERKTLKKIGEYIDKHALRYSQENEAEILNANKLSPSAYERSSQIQQPKTTDIKNTSIGKTSELSKTLRPEISTQGKSLPIDPKSEPYTPIQLAKHAETFQSEEVVTEHQASPGSIQVGSPENLTKPRLV